MADFKFNLAVYDIDKEDGTLKFIYVYKTNIMPQIGSTLCHIINDENGVPVKRVYHKVDNILYPLIDGDKDTVQLGCEPVIHAILEIDEPILNN